MMRYRDAKTIAHRHGLPGETTQQMHGLPGETTQQIYEGAAFRLANGRWVVLQYQTRYAQLMDSVWREPVWKDVE